MLNAVGGGKDDNINLQTTIDTGSIVTQQQAMIK